MIDFVSIFSPLSGLTEFIIDANETLLAQTGMIFIPVIRSFPSHVILSNVHQAILLLLVLILTTAHSNMITNVVMMRYHTSHPAYHAISLNISHTNVISDHAVVLWNVELPGADMISALPNTLDICSVLLTDPGCHHITWNMLTPRINTIAIQPITKTGWKTIHSISFTENAQSHIFLSAPILSISHNTIIGENTIRNHR